MESLIYLINSYLNSRSALLRSLEDHSLSTAMLTSSVLTSSVISNRRRNQTTWRPDELAKLAEELRMSTGAIINLYQLAPRLLCLPNSLLRPLLKPTSLDRHKLAIRSRDMNYWQYIELVQLVSALRRWPGIHDQENSILPETDSTSAITSYNADRVEGVEVGCGSLSYPILVAHELEEN